MTGDFGKFVNEKRKGRGQGDSDILLRDLAEAMGNMSVSYLSDIIKGRRKPPEKKLLDIMADVLKLDEEERNDMNYLAGLEREEVSPDLPDYIMDANIPHVRAALRSAKKAGLGDDFWQRVNESASGIVDLSDSGGRFEGLGAFIVESDGDDSPIILSEVIKKAKDKGLGDEFWKRVLEEMEGDDSDGE